MLNRQRIPTIFSIYMLDVICCALGCVILLWQLKHSEAEELIAAAKLASTKDASATSEIAALQAELAASHKQHDAATQLLALRKDEHDALRQAYLISEALLKDVRIDLDRLQDQHKLAVLAMAEKVNANTELLLQIAAADKKLQAQVKLTAVQKLDAAAAAQRLADQKKLAALDLAERTKANAALLAQISAAQTTVQTLEKQTARQKLDAAEAARRLQELLARLQSIELNNKSLEKQAADLRAADKDSQARLTAQALRVKVLEQELDKSKTALAVNSREAGDAVATIAALQKEKLILVNRAQAMQLEAEQRFAGIALTGQNVLFLVDMSGSMAMADEKTADPDKWPLVCETVLQLMRSIKGLQFFQVILFSDRVRYPLGGNGVWLKYDPKATPQKTLAALRAIKPEGETNMHAVFSEAFRYREAKLDTIYVLSDGLPNAGDDLPANLSEAERTTILSKHLRAKLRNDWNRPIADQPRVRINSIGFFFESPDVARFLLGAVARA